MEGLDLRKLFIALASQTGGTDATGKPGGEDGRTILQRMWWATRYALLTGAITRRDDWFGASRPQASHAPG